MKLYTRIVHIFLLMALYQCLIIEGKSKKKHSKKVIKQKHKGKKQYFPGGHMQATYPHPGPYNSMPQYNTGTQNVQVAKGFPASFDCTRAEFGCCWDGRTPAHGGKGKGCPQCRDVYKDFCKKTKDLCHYPMVADYCRVTCELCVKGKKSNCESSEHNCCWDGTTTAKGPHGKGCPKIKDKLSSGECAKFEAECLRNPYFMWTKCRASCLKNLPPIHPYLHVLTSGSPGSTGGQTPYGGHLAMPNGMPAFPGFPQGNNTVGKKTSAALKHKVKKKSD